MELRSKEGVEVVQFDNAPLIRFLHRTYGEDAPDRTPMTHMDA